ncbi:MAG TPA: ABC transporter ATP-binding protein [Pseudolysinimonas sp.]
MTESAHGSEAGSPHRGGIVERVLSATGVTRIFGTGEAAVTACADVDLDVGVGELVVIRGRSGAGKTTLLNLLGGLDRPTSGSIRLFSPDGSNEVDLAAAPERQLVTTRRDTFGFVFQDFGLLPVLSAAENIELPLRLAGMDPGEREERVSQLLELVGLSGNRQQRPDELSGGQQQRVGIARALARRPRILLADEPTAQLDSGTGAEMIDLLVDVVRTEGATAIVTTHDDAMASRADVTVMLRDGRVEAPEHGRHRAAE